MYISTHYLTHRIIIGKFLGLVFGFIFGMLLFDLEAPISHPILFALGTEFWYATMGGMIAMAGIWEKHPTFNFNMHPWIRGGVIGLLMNIILVCFTYDDTAIILQTFGGPISGDASAPFIVRSIQGFFTGSIIDITISHFAKKNTKHEIRKKV